MSRRLAVLILLLAPVAAFAAEIPLTQPVHGPAALSQLGASAASDGDGYFIVWNDNRSGGTETRGTRVTGEGEVLDPTGIPLPITSVEPVHMVWTGTSYLLVWNTHGPNAVWALRVDRNGAVVDGPRVAAENALATSVATSGTHAVIAYETPVWVPNFRRALFLTHDGARAADVQLAGPNEQGGRLQIAWNGSHFAAIWLDSGDLSQNKFSVSGVRFDVTGRLDAAPRKLFVDGPSLELSVASDGTDFVLLAREYATDLFYARRISADLATVGAPTVMPEGQASSATLLWAGAHYVAIGRSGNRIIGVKLDRDGRPLDGAAVIENLGNSGSLGVPVAATNGRDLLVGWSGELVAESTPESDVFGTLVAASTLAPRARSLLTVSAPRQYRPLVASGVTNLLAVWHERTGLYARRLAPNGTSIDPEPLRLGPPASAMSVVFNGSDYIVVWTELIPGQAIRTARVRRDGALRVDGGARVAARFIEALAAASDGATTLLLWHSESGLEAVRLGANGSVLDSVPLTLFSKHTFGKVAVSPDGAGTFLVVWEQYESLHYPPYASSRHLRGARVTRELTNLDAGGFDVTSGSSWEREPSVVWNGREWVVVSTRLDEDIYARTVATNGTVGTAVSLVAEGRQPAVTWDGSRYFLTWLNENRVLRSAWLHDLGAEFIAARTLAERAEDPAASLVPLGRGLVVTAYARIVEEPDSGGVSRAFVNLVGAPPKRRAVR